MLIWKHVPGYLEQRMGWLPENSDICRLGAQELQHLLSQIAIAIMTDSNVEMSTSVFVTLDLRHLFSEMPIWNLTP